MGMDKVSQKKDDAPAQPAPFEFVITQGQQQAVFGKDGSVNAQLNNDKIDPNCKNSVKTADGSEQRFDSQGLCKVRGNVKWGKSADGLMEITVGGEGQQVKMYLDKNWKLASVKGESTSYDSSMKLPELKLQETKVAEAPSAPPAKPAKHEGWKPLHAHKTEPARAPKAEAPHLRPAMHAPEIGAWKTEVKVAPKSVPPRAERKPEGPKVGEPLNLLPEHLR